MDADTKRFCGLVSKATGDNAGVAPYRYQTKLAVDGFPDVLCAPTGAGKTMAVVLGWLYRRRFHSDQNVRKATPRRLVIALPMRVLVEQTEAVVRGWISNLEEAAGTAFHLTNQDTVGVHVVMGGAASREWVTRPEQDTVIIGTVDMLLSAALNRGYGLSQWVWPIYFGLLNNDTFWVFDEVQMTPDATATSRQLQAFRESFGTLLPTRSMWMSATLDPSTLDVVDCDLSRAWIMTVSGDGLRIDDGDPRTDVSGGAEPEDRYCPSLSATKTFSQLRLPEKQTKTRKGERSALLAKTALAEHRKSLDGGGNPPTTIVICNTVQRAQEVAAALREVISSKQGAAPSKGPSSDTSDDSATPGSSTTGPEIVLLHSRFRFRDRQRIVRDLLSPVENADGRIVVATQVIEAGVDITSRTLITELAPLPSIVQRAGRCNRNGETSGARVLWVEPEKPLPYSKADLEVAREFLSGTNVNDCSITAETLSQQVHELYGAAWKRSKTQEDQTLDLNSAGVEKIMGNLLKGNVSYATEQSESTENRKIVSKIIPRTLSVIRDKDLMDLFDTLPNLSGTHTDISRFIRSDLDLDVEIVWRDTSQMLADEEVPYPSRDERCPVPIGEAEKWLDEQEKKGRFLAWCPDPLERRARSQKARSGNDENGDRRPRRKQDGLQDKRWVPCRSSEIYPGLLLIVGSEYGGYDPEQGFVGSREKSTSVNSLPKSANGGAGASGIAGTGDEQRAEAGQPSASAAADLAEMVECEDIAVGDDPGSSTAQISLEQHLNDTRKEALRLAVALQLPKSWAEASVWGAALHDVGKASIVFQKAVKAATDEVPLAKSGKRGRLVYKRRFNVKKQDGTESTWEVTAKYFRHELVSALWLLDPGMRGFLRKRYEESLPQAALVSGADEAPENSEKSSQEGARPDVATSSELRAESLSLTDPAPTADEKPLPEETWLDIVTYLVAAHHGRVRLGFRSLPGEESERDQLLAALSVASEGQGGKEDRCSGGDAPGDDLRYALGVLEGETVRLKRQLEFDGGAYTVTVPASEFTVDLSVMELGSKGGGETWRSRMVPLCDDKSVGPFRLGFAEALVRIADWIASSSAPGGADNVC